MKTPSKIIVTSIQKISNDALSKVGTQTQSRKIQTKMTFDRLKVHKALEDNFVL